MTTREAIETIADHYEYESQSRQCMEECGELIQAINKFWRKRPFFASYDLFQLEEDKEEITNSPEYQNLCEEITDCLIMEYQLIHLLNADEITGEILIEKLQRQLDRMGEEQMGEEWEDKICGTCRYHKIDGLTNDWACTKEDSDKHNQKTEYDDQCEEWGGR